MTDKPQPFAPPGSQFLVYQTEDGKLKLDVRFEGETVWLTQQHMADLFQTTQQNVSLHLQNIYEEGELQRGATHKDVLSDRLAEGEVSHDSVVKNLFTTADRISHETAQVRAEKARRSKP